MQNTPHHPLVLIILDGWGYSDKKENNPLDSVSTPHIDQLAAQHPPILLAASGPAVGLPEGQMGNSEVGHLHIGAGRKVPQDLTRINDAIKTGEFFKNPTLTEALTYAKKQDKAVHIMGLLSPGGVHSLDTHLASAIELAQQHGLDKHYLHAILDGRDTPPKSAQHTLEKLNALYQKLGHGKIASLIGRYYAMDRDKRWDRTQRAYELLTQGTADYVTTNALTGLEHAYANNQTDEFVKPISIHSPEEPAVTLQDGDVVIFMNFRADRARQLSHALTAEHFDHFDRHVVPKLARYITLTQYAQELKATVAFPPLELNNTLGEFVSTQGGKQLRIAETEKYAHVTYFINGGRECQFDNEDRVLIASPKVATYDLKPEMSALELTDKLVAAIESQQYELIICNYANPDMIGHTGVWSAAEKTVSVIDQCLNRILTALNATGCDALITADHGNIECMYDEIHDQPHTAHTTNLVPLFHVGRKAHFLRQHGSLDDIAPTALYLMGHTPPPEMTGQILLKLD